MSDYIYNSLNSLSSVFSVNISDRFPRIGCCDDISTGTQAAERLFHSGLVLSPGEHVGLQISYDKEDSFVSYAFSSTESAVSADDFNWILEGFAKVEDLSTDSLDDFFDARKVYTLRPVDSGCDSTNYNLESERRPYDAMKYVRAMEISNMFRLVEANIRIIAGTDNNGVASGWWMILISLPQAISLRMSSALSYVFPDLGIVEISGIDEDPKNHIHETSLIDDIGDIMDCILQKKSARACTYNHEDDIEDEELYYDDIEEYVEYLEDDKDDVETGGVSIEELELSVRACNCLKRGDINSIEKLRSLSDSELMNIRNLGKKCFAEIKQKLAEYEEKKEAVSDDSPQRDYWAELDELIGLNGVKEQVRRIQAFARMNKDIISRGKKAIPMVLNMEFVGNPGTAKTTIARIVAGIFKDIGVLESDEIVEVGRADLVAKYIGQTAIKVKDVFEKAKGKLLFIDEAYSLVDNWEGEYGDEAISTIVQEMENNRNETIVIFAGYADKMANFISRNPGLRSRVPFRIVFDDYSADEMVQIVEMEARKRDFEISVDATKEVLDICTTAMGNPDAGNGRFCRNIVEDAILNYASRVYSDMDAGGNKDYVLISSDFSLPKALSEKKKIRPIGFRMSA